VSICGNTCIALLFFIFFAGTFSLAFYQREFLRTKVAVVRGAGVFAELLVCTFFDSCTRVFDTPNGFGLGSICTVFEPAGGDSTDDDIACE
jgi:hypothetical protein